MVTRSVSMARSLERSLPEWRPRRLGKFLGLGFIAREYAKIGTEIDILVRGKPKKAVVVKRPFYTPVYRK